MTWTEMCCLLSHQLLLKTFRADKGLEPGYFDLLWPSSWFETISKKLEKAWHPVRLLDIKI